MPTHLREPDQSLRIILPSMISRVPHRRRQSRAHQEPVRENQTTKARPVVPADEHSQSLRGEPQSDAYRRYESHHRRYAQEHDVRTTDAVELGGLAAHGIGGHDGFRERLFTVTTTPKGNF